MNTQHIVDIVNKISLNLNIEKNKSRQSPIDSLKVLKDLLSKKSRILTYLEESKINLETDPEFKYLYDTITGKDYIRQLMLGNNHYDNPFLHIHFILGNPYLFNLEIFDVLYSQKEQMRMIPKLMKRCWIHILKSDLRNFFNETLIDKWLKTSEFKMLTKEDVLKVEGNTELTYHKYVEMYRIFDAMNCKVRKFIFRLKDEINTQQNPGSINLKNKEYLSFIRTYTGLELDYTKINILITWAKRELERLKTDMKNILIKIRPDLANKEFVDIIKALQDDPKYKYKTKEDFVNHHKDIMEKMHQFFIGQMKIKEFVKPTLTVLNDPNLGGAYWAYDTFYLNVTNWDKINDYQALPLTLHEAVPGHHTQVSYATHSETDGYDVLYNWFGTTSGFHEGWALFTEKLSPSYTDMERIGQLQYEMLRTIRVLVDIGIHAGGVAPNNIVNFMLTYLAMPRPSIESEVYRYVVLPGQALGYKLGATIIKKIHEKYVGDADLLSEKSIELYKKIIYDKAKPLDILMKNYNITFEEVFG